MSNNDPLPKIDFPSSANGLNIYFYISENSGVGYYRQYLPAIKLREHNLANVIISDFKWGKGEHFQPDIQMVMQIMQWADLVVIGRKDEGQFYAQWGAIKEFFNIPVVIDTDDNVHHVRPTNPGYQGYHPGAEALVWNKYGTSKIFDAITVSTQNLVDVYKKYNPKVFVLPNNLDMQWWNNVKRKEHNDGLVRLGFIASAAHPEGIQMIKDPLIKILQKHPHVRLLITAFYKPIFDSTPVKDQVIAIPWIDLQEWPEKYAELGLDIGLAPLADNLFNRAKSNLRWMEYCAQGVPSIVSPVEAYNCVHDGKDALVAQEKEDWFNAMEKLILDPELRKTMGRTGLQRIETDYNIDRNIGLWKKTYEDIHSKYHDFFGDKKRFYIGKKGLQELGAKRRK